MSLSQPNFNGSLIVIQIKDSINRSNFHIKVSPDISGFDLKKQIENENDNLESQNIRLVFKGKLLSDDFSLYHQGVKNSSILFLIPQKVQKIENQTSNEIETSLKSNDNSSAGQLLHVFQVCPTCVRTRSVKLLLNSQIQILDGAFTSNSLYVYQGMILDKNETFDYYNIINESTIVFIPEDLSKANPSLLDKWLKLTNDTERFQSIICSKAKKSCINESSRLIDIIYNNLELKRKAYRSVFNEDRISIIETPQINMNPNDKKNLSKKNMSYD